MILWQVPGTWNEETKRAWYDQTKWLLMSPNRQVHYSNIQHRFDSFARFGTLPNRKSALKGINHIDEQPLYRFPDLPRLENLSVVT
jgi:hypothetical protein